MQLKEHRYKLHAGIKPSAYIVEPRCEFQQFDCLVSWRGAFTSHHSNCICKSAGICSSHFGYVRSARFKPSKVQNHQGQPDVDSCRRRFGGIQPRPDARSPGMVGGQGSDGRFTKEAFSQRFICLCQSSGSRIASQCGAWF